MKPRDVTIKTKLGGWVVKVGCTEVVFTDREILFNALRLYLTNPEKTEEEYLDGAINAEFFHFVVRDEVEQTEAENEPLPYVSN